MKALPSYGYCRCTNQDQTKPHFCLWENWTKAKQGTSHINVVAKHYLIYRWHLNVICCKGLIKYMNQDWTKSHCHLKENQTNGLPIWNLLWKLYIIYKVNTYAYMPFNSTCLIMLSEQGRCNVSTINIYAYTSTTVYIVVNPYSQITSEF